MIYFFTFIIKINRLTVTMVASVVEPGWVLWQIKWGSLFLSLLFGGPFLYHKQTSHTQHNTGYTTETFTLHTHTHTHTHAKLNS